MVAIMALGQTESDDAVPVLKDFAMKGVNKRVRSAAVNALGQIGTEKAKAALLDILGMK
jgi:HEAT repeat protein